jgi:hypothetical protein
MDGITKKISEFLERIDEFSDMAILAIKEQIDLEANAVFEEIKAGTPEKTGGLKNSLKKTSIDTPKKYGYKIEYEGNAPDGTPYAKIANVLNYGSSTIKPKKFITKAIHKIKGLDERAAKRFENRIK